MCVCVCGGGAVYVGPNQDFTKRGKFACQDISGVNLENCKFGSKELSETNFQNCNLQNVDFRNAELDYAEFQGADLRGADLRGADLNKKLNMTEALVYQIQSLKNN